MRPAGAAPGAALFAVAAVLLAADGCGDERRPSARPAPATGDERVDALAGGDDRFTVVLAPARGTADGDALISAEVARALGVPAATAFDLHVYRSELPEPVEDRGKQGGPAAVPLPVAPLELTVTTDRGPGLVLEPEPGAAGPVLAIRSLSAYRSVELLPGQGFTARFALSGRIAPDALTAAEITIGGATLVLAHRRLPRAVFDDLVEGPNRATLVAVLTERAPAGARNEHGR